MVAEDLTKPDFARRWAETPVMATPKDQHKFRAEFGDAETLVAVLPAELAAAGRREMWLSQQTIGKIKARHSQVRPEHVLLVQAAVDGADVFAQIPDARWLGFARDGKGNLWAVAWKWATDTGTGGGKIYVTAIYRSSPQHLARMAKKWPRVNTRVKARVKKRALVGR